jgi:quinol monooxygenase YgiN
VRFELNNEQDAFAFDKLVEETAQDIAAHEPGTLVYATHNVKDSPLSRVFYEVYRDKEAFEEHEKQAHTLRFLQEREKFTASVRVEFLSPREVTGLPPQT